MKKQEFQIVISTGNKRKTVNIKGNTGKYFGVHKDEKGKYSVTHIPTGRKFTEFKKLKQAKFFIEKTETEVFPVSWEVGDIYMNLEHSKTTLKRISNNLPKAKQIIQMASKI